MPVYVDIWVDFEILLILWGNLKFFDGWVWVVDFCGGGAEMLDFSRDLGNGEGECYEKMTVRVGV